MSSLLKMLAALCVLLIAAPVQAATITERPDLFERLSQLKLIFPPVSRVSWFDPSGRYESGDHSDAVEHAGVFGEQGVEYPTYADLGMKIVKLDGEIVAGDTNKLRAALGDNSGGIVVLNSPGGSFTEGLKIGKLFQELANLTEENRLALAVYVLKEDKCISACALAFSQAIMELGVYRDIRFIEAGARVGFHMPFPTKEDGDQMSTVSGALGLALDTTTSINELVMGGANPPELLKQVMLQRDPAKTFDVHGDLEGWRYRFTPVADNYLAAPVASSSFGINVVRQVCEVLGATRFYFAYEDSPPYLDAVDDAVQLNDIAKGGGPLEASLWNSTYRCDIKVTDGKLAVAVYAEAPDCLVPPEDSESGGCAAKIGLTSPVTVGLLAAALGCSSDGKLLWPQGGPNDNDLTTTTVRTANLRQGPDGKAEVIAELPAETDVHVVGCRITSDSPNVWYAVGAGGHTGWISARLLRGLPNNPGVLAAWNK